MTKPRVVAVTAPEPSTDEHLEAGFSLIEMLVALLLLSLVSTAFYQVLFAQTRASEVTETVTDVSGAARLGFNRMVRDTREAALIDSANPAAYTIKINYDGNGVYANPNSRGVSEILTYSYNSGTGTITLNGETLVSGVSAAPGKDIFTFSSNWLEYDWNNDGTTTWQELDVASSSTYGVVGVGNNDGILNSGELPYLTTVTFALRVTAGNHFTDFTATSQLRNLV